MSDKNIGYFAVKPDASLSKDLTKYLRKIGLKNPISSSHLHVTLMYSIHDRINHALADAIRCPASVYTDVTLKGIEILGDAIVVAFDSESLKERFKELSLFLTHSYDDLNLHLSLTYFDDDAIAKESLELLTKHKKEIFELLEGLTLGEEYFESLED